MAYEDKKTALELLAPARTPDIGMKAILAGADAVYIGAEKFGARAQAVNSFDEISEFIQFAHFYRAKVYITINTILYDNELSQAEELIHNYHSAGADAIIIQDMGILEMNLPPIPLFASTQCHNTDYKRINFLESVGIQRVILPRELSLNEIQTIRENCKVDLEFFVAGSLCVSYSGRCYMSQAICSRSANRGECAQPCRSHYTVTDTNNQILVRNKHVLSLKDLNISHKIGDLAKAGISSFKIEGRMKDSTYVQNLTAKISNELNLFISNNKDYVRASSGYSEINFKPDPEKSFNRGFSEHLLLGRTMKQTSWKSQKSLGKMIGTVKKTGIDFLEIDTNEELRNGDGICYFSHEGKLEGSYIQKIIGKRIFSEKFNNLKIGTEIYRNLDIRFEKEVNAKLAERRIDVNIIMRETDEGFSLEATDSDNISVYKEFLFPKIEARNPAEAKKSLYLQLSKSGNARFSIKSVDILCGNWFFPVSAINQERRSVLELLEEKRMNSYTQNLVKIIPNSVAFPYKEIDYQYNVSNLLAERFYRRHGVEKIEKAIEADKNSWPDVLMTTKYCLRFEMGICPKQKKGEQALDLFIEDNERKYRLRFNCKACQMLVLSAST